MDLVFKAKERKPYVSFNKINFYVKCVNDGRKTIDEVPEDCREQVIKKLEVKADAENND